MVVNSTRTVVPQLQSVHSNPLHMRRKAKFSSSDSALHCASGIDTVSSPLEAPGGEKRCSLK